MHIPAPHVNLNQNPVIALLSQLSVHEVRKWPPGMTDEATVKKGYKHTAVCFDLCSQDDVHTHLSTHPYDLHSKKRVLILGFTLFKMLRAQAVFQIKLDFR